ncbi:MAG: hypothetical protein QXG00_02855 [Candidatus Woesearchaeota archaeon]
MGLIINNGLEILITPNSNGINQEKLFFSFRDKNKQIGSFYSDVMIQFTSHPLSEDRLYKTLDALEELKGIVVDLRRLEYNDYSDLIRVVLPLSKRVEFRERFKELTKTSFKLPFVTEGIKKQLDYNFLLRFRNVEIHPILLEIFRLQRIAEKNFQNYIDLLEKYYDDRTINRIGKKINKIIFSEINVTKNKKEKQISEEVIDLKKKFFKAKSDLLQFARTYFEDTNLVENYNHIKPRIDLHLNVIDYKLQEGVLPHRVFFKTINGMKLIETNTFDFNILDWTRCYIDVETTNFHYNKPYSNKCKQWLQQFFIPEYKKYTGKEFNTIDEILDPKGEIMTMINNRRKSITHHGMMFKKNGELIGFEGLIYNYPQKNIIVKLGEKTANFFVHTFFPTEEQVGAYFKNSDITKIINSEGNEREKYIKEFEKTTGIKFSLGKSKEDQLWDNASRLSELNMVKASCEFHRTSFPLINIGYYFMSFDLEILKRLTSIKVSEKSFQIDTHYTTTRKSGGPKVFLERQTAKSQLLIDLLEVVINYFPEIYEVNRLKHKPLSLETVSEYFNIPFKKKFSHDFINFINVLSFLGCEEATRLETEYHVRDIVVMDKLMDCMKDEFRAIVNVAINSNVNLEDLLYSPKGIQDIWNYNRYWRIGRPMWVGHDRYRKIKIKENFRNDLKKELVTILNNKILFNLDKRECYPEALIAYIPRGFFFKEFIGENFPELNKLLSLINPAGNQKEQKVYAICLEKLIEPMELDYVEIKTLREEYEKNVNYLSFAIDEDKYNFINNMQSNIIYNSDIQALMKYASSRTAVLREKQRLEELLDEKTKENEYIQNVRESIKKANIRNYSKNFNQKDLFNSPTTLLEIENPEIGVLENINNKKLDEETEKVYKDFISKLNKFRRKEDYFITTISPEVRERIGEEIRDYCYLLIQKIELSKKSSDFSKKYRITPKKVKDTLLNGYEQIAGFINNYKTLKEAIEQRITGFISESGLKIIKQRGNLLLLESLREDSEQKLKDSDCLIYLTKVKDYIPDKPNLINQLNNFL